MRQSTKLGFSREQRLRRKAQITSVLARGRSTACGGVRLHSMPSSDGPRFGIIAGRRAWPRAVDRNCFKRLARETFRLLQHQLQSRDYIIRAHNPKRGAKRGEPKRGEPNGAEIRKLLAAWCRTEGVK